jgi:nucleoid-associated protein YgaU
VEGGWSGLYDANRQVIGANPNLIKPGQTLTLDLG